MLLAMAERRLGLAEKLSRVLPDRRDPTRIVHSLADMFRARMFAICCGYEDADDLDHLRCDPAFKLACGRLPDSGRDLCSQPTLSRLENAPRLRDVLGMTRDRTYLACAEALDIYPQPREGWIPVPLGPPVAPRQIFSACVRTPKIPNKHGPSRTKLCTAAPRRGPKIRSLRPSFSKPLDFAVLVRIVRGAKLVAV